MARVVYRVSMVVLSVVLALAGGRVLREHLGRSSGVLAAAAETMTSEQRQEYYEHLASLTQGLYDAVPEPNVGRVLQRRTRKRLFAHEVAANNAGMRSSRDYGPKEPGVFRIACLGDSFVFGEGGSEEDRWSTQLAETLERMDVRPDGRRVEVYNFGIGSWTALNEASFLSSRLSAYQPDLVLALLTSNDITDSSGVLGIGEPTQTFTSEARELGSGAFYSECGKPFGVPGHFALAWSYCPESELRWRRAFEAWKRLEGLLEGSGARLLFSVLDGNPPFVDLCRDWFQRVGMGSPFVVVDFFGERLEHDGHPNRQGHAILANHYLHVLAELGWLPIDRNALAPLREGSSTSTTCTSDPDELARLLQRRWGTHAEALDFAVMTAEDLRCFLGGIYPKDGNHPFDGLPDASVRAGFVLRKKPGAREVAVTIEVSPRPELYPLEIGMTVSGNARTSLTLPGPERAGRHELRVSVPEDPYPVFEIVLEANHHYCEIADPTMRTYSLVAARQFP